MKRLLTARCAFRIRAGTFSSYLTGRSGNRGECASCRWEYFFAKRPVPTIFRSKRTTAELTYLTARISICSHTSTK
ncbi:MAG: U32 family peptidase [Christensenellales bacterium]